MRKELHIYWHAGNQNWVVSLRAGEITDGQFKPVTSLSWWFDTDQAALTHIIRLAQEA